ncbi:MAG: MarR family transcriptional regulator [Desulfovibrionaceae bacterium]
MSKNRSASGTELHELFMQTFALRDALARIMDKGHAEAGLSTPQARILRLLENRETLTVPDLARSLGISRQFILKTVHELSTAGLVAFEENPRHKRSMLLRITEQGLAARKAFREREDAIVQRMLPETDAASVHAASALLKALCRDVEALHPEG